MAEMCIIFLKFLMEKPQRESTDLLHLDQKVPSMMERMHMMPATYHTYLDGGIMFVHNQVKLEDKDHNWYSIIISKVLE